MKGGRKNQNYGVQKKERKPSSNSREINLLLIPAKGLKHSASCAEQHWQRGEYNRTTIERVPVGDKKRVAVYTHTTTVK